MGTSKYSVNESPMFCGLGGKDSRSKSTLLPVSLETSYQNSAIYQSIREVTTPLNSLSISSPAPVGGSTESRSYGLSPTYFLRVPPEDSEVYSHISHMHRGQLKLALYVNHGHLTVHVIQARNLRPKTSGTCDSFVKVSLIPDGSERTTCTTEMVYGTHNPMFDEKFSFEMLEQDKKKRLMVSLWNKERENSQKHEMVGCMSFGMKHMLCKKKQRHVGGWYYLLSEDLGRRKHLQAMPKRSHVHKTIPEVNKDLAGLESITMVVQRAKSGYGFTVTGGCPVRVGRIEDKSHAKTVGLQKGDCIVRINGQNVSRSTPDSVAKLLKNSQKQVVLDVQRAIPQESEENRIPLPPPRKPSRRSSAAYEMLSLKENMENIPRRHNRSSSSSTKRSGSHDGSVSSWQMEGRNDECSLHQKSSSTGTYEELSSVQQNNVAMVVEDSMHANVGTDDELSDMEHSMSELDQTCDERLGALPQLTLSFQDLTCKEQERQAAVQRLVECEQEFIQCMQQGVQRYSRPLRHCILAPQEHSTLFQNIEKLLAISEFHVRQLQENSLGYTEMDTTVDRFIDSVGEYYHSKVLVMCEAYERYCNGAANAAHLLAELTQYDEFNKFLDESRSSSQILTIRQFLDRPIQHIHTLAALFEQICSLTQSNHHDYSDLQDVAQVLQGAWSRISKSGRRRTRSSASVSSSRHSRSSSRSATSTASIDSELLGLQARLVFPKHIQAFPLAIPTRHVIYSGELLLVQKTKWVRLTVLLLSDLLLLTKAEANNKLLVVEEPIPLSSISSAEFDRMHPSEFGLDVGCNGTRDSKNMLFRAPSLELKCTWKNILEQRVAACRALQDLMPGRTGDALL